jgi:hypothetical protein
MIFEGPMWEPKLESILKCLKHDFFIQNLLQLYRR